MQQESLTLKAPAKINLYLKVTGRRADGYHTLETLMQKLSLCDVVDLRVRDRGIRLHCPGSALAENSDNLVYRAAALFFQTVGSQRPRLRSGVEITLTKNIPVAAGLGGGSSDAAATLKGLNRLFACGCSKAELAAMGLRLGADVPFFLADTSAAVATGIGELLAPAAPLRGYSVLLVNPGFPVSTQWVYQTFALTNNGNMGKLNSFREDVGESGDSGSSREGGAHLAAMHNDLEVVTISRYPEIELLKKELVAQGAITALMSGSGPTVFGIFADQRDAEASLVMFKRRFEQVCLVSPFAEKE